MVRSITAIFLCCFVFAATGCSKKASLSKERVFQMLYEGDPDIEVLVPESITKPLVVCSQYRPPCEVGYKVKIKNMEVTGLYYEDHDSALQSAQAIGGYHLKNWAFDQVSGEPILERFFQNHLNAKKVGE